VSRASPFSLRLASRLAPVSPGEGRALFAASACLFALMASSAALRPLRDALALSGDEQQLPWMIAGTLGATALVHPVFAALVARLPRSAFVPLVAHASAAALCAFWVALRFAPEGPARLAAARAFFVWAGVFNLFAPSVFWGLMADVFRSDQALRLFGVIGVGGTLGAALGSLVAASLVARVGPAWVLLASALLLEGALVLSRALLLERPPEDAPCLPAAPAPSVWEGARRVIVSPYLLGICAYLLLFTVTSTLLYLEQAHLVAGALEGTAARAALFARVDLAINLLTVLGQCPVTSRVLGALGVA